MESITQNHVFTRKLLLWYHKNQRDLPWRSTSDPYRIWLSEVILQQTRVAQGLPYFYKFVHHFPTVKHLAEATEREVLRLWQGLGYYSRARNLHRCAQLIVGQYQGHFPTTYRELLLLPGIGDYTASAIASFAFGKQEPVVDGNVFRVLSRIFGVTSEISSARARKEFKQLSGSLMDPKNPQTYNQAIMEFGALHCLPALPKCGACPFSDFCFANQRNLQAQLPIKKKRAVIRERYFNYYLIRCGNRLLMKQREAKDIWRGLFDFLLHEDKQAVDPLNGLENLMPEAKWRSMMTIQDPSAVYKHKLTHQHIFARFTELEVSVSQDLKPWMEHYDLQEFELGEIMQLPKPILIDKYLKAAIF